MRSIIVTILMFFLSCNNLNDEFKIYIDCTSKVFVNTEGVRMNRFKELIKDYYLQNSSSSIVSIKVCAETSVKTVVEIKNIIKSTTLELRNEYAKQKFKKNVDSLPAEQLKVINKKYPLKINFIKSE